MMDIDYKPFFLSYLHRIVLASFIALVERQRFSLVYSASDFLMDCIPGFIHKLKGNKWVAGYYLQAFPENKIHFWTQKLARFIINRFADMVIVTNPTMFNIFPDKKKTWINGGIDLSKCGLTNQERPYDLVFCGRIHKSKGIDELLEIWKIVNKILPSSKLAVIGDGDLGMGYIRNKVVAMKLQGIDLFGYMQDERFDIYKKSKMVIYPTPHKYDHFSMAPIEAMACGCPMVCFDISTILKMKDLTGMKSVRCGHTERQLAYLVVELLRGGKWKNLVLGAQEYASQFDYKKQSQRVLWNIRKELDI